MRVLLIHAKINFDNMEPLGALSLATSLRREGHEARVLDLFPGDDDFALQRILAFRPDCIGYSIETPAYARISRFHRQLRHALPKAIYCAGGAHATARPKQVLESLHLDFIMRGEADQTFPLLLNEGPLVNWSTTPVPGVAWLEDGVFHSRGPTPRVENLDSLPIIDRSLVYDYPFYLLPPGNIRGLVRPGTATLIASRGCSNSCAFCASHTVGGVRHRRRSIPHLLTEIRHLESRFNVSAVYFADDSFTAKRDWVLDFCRAIARHHPRLRWACQSRADRIDQEVAAAMRGAGCVQVDMGVESADPQLLLRLRKGESVEQITTAARIIRANKMRLLCSFVVGSPGESWESIETTRRLITRIKPSMCQYFTLVPYPGTALASRSAPDIGTPRYDENFSQKRYRGGRLASGMPPAEHDRARRYLQNTTVVRDHLLLVVGWLRYPHYVMQFIGAALHHALFIPALMRGLSCRTPVGFLTEVYAAFNRTMLRRIRQPEPVYPPQGTREGYRRTPAPVATQPVSRGIPARPSEHTAA